MTIKKEAKISSGSTNLFADLLRRRDEERRRIVQATKVVDGASVPLESNPMGIVPVVSPSRSGESSAAQRSLLDTGTPSR